MKRQEKRRLVENEVIFRQVNQDIDGFLHDMDAQKILKAPFYCECSNLECSERIELSAAEYEKIHRNAKRFIVIPGHENPKIEKIVEPRKRYFIIEKLTELPSAEEVTYRLREFKL